MAIGGVGVSSETAPPSDLDTIYMGGEFFLERMKAMGQQTADAKKALADLALGKEAVAANTAAKAAFADAQKKSSDATAALAAAKDEAAKIVADAKVRAEKIVLDAKTAAASIVAQASDVKASADEYAKTTKKQVNDLLADTKAKNDDLSSQTALAKKTQAEADTLKALSNKAIKDAQATQKLFEDKLAKLQSIISG